MFKWDLPVLTREGVHYGVRQRAEFAGFRAFGDGSAAMEDLEPISFAPGGWLTNVAIMALS